MFDGTNIKLVFYYRQVLPIWKEYDDSLVIYQSIMAMMNCEYLMLTSDPSCFRPEIGGHARIQTVIKALRF